MPTKLAPGHTDRTRPLGVVPTTLHVTREAHAWLRELAPRRKAHGHVGATLRQQDASKRDLTRTFPGVLPAEGTMQA